MGPTVIAGQQLPERRFNILLRAGADLDQREPDGSMWRKDVDQPAAKWAAEPKHGRGEIDDVLGARVEG